MSASREKFVETLIEHVRGKFPLVKIARGQEPFSVHVNGHIATLENLYRSTQLQPAEMNHHIDRWMVELLRASEGTPDQTGDLEQIRARIFPMIMASHNKQFRADIMITQPLIDHLVISYAVDGDRTMAYIPRGVFDKWKISIDELHEMALKNLIDRSEQMAAHAAQDEDGQINLILFQTMDGYDASRILLPTLHDRLAGHLGSPFVAAVPNRDILLCFRDDPQTVTALRQQIQQDFRQMPHQISDHLFLITPDGIAARP